MSGVKRKYAVGSLWFFLGQGTSNIASFIIFAILARLLGPAEFGLVAFATVFIDLSRSVALAGLPTALIKERDWDDATASTAFWGNMIFATLLAIIVILAAFLFGESYGGNFHIVVSALCACLLLDALRATHEAKLEREFRFKNLAKRTAFATTGAGIIGVALAFAGWGVWALVVNRIANSAIQSLLVWQAEPWVPKLLFHRAQFARLFRFGMHLGASAVLGQINRRVPDLVAGLFIGPVAVGYYRVGSRMVNMLVDLTISPMQRTAIAGFSRVETPEGLVHAYRRVTRIVALMAFPAFFGMAILANDLVRLLFGAQWAESGVVMSMLALVGGAASVSYFVQPLLAVAGKAGLASSRSLLMLISNTVVCLITAPFGIAALALGFSVRGYVGLIPTLYLLKHAVGLPPMKVVGDVFPSFAGATIMAIVVFSLQRYAFADFNMIVRIALLVPLGALIYAVVLLVFFRKFIREIWGDVESLVVPALRYFKR